MWGFNPRPKSASALVKRSRPLLGTVVEVQAIGNNRDRLHQLISECFTIGQRLEDCLSIFKNTSDLARINRASIGDIIHIRQPTVGFLNFSIAISAMSNQLADINCGSALVEAGMRTTSSCRKTSWYPLEDCLDLTGDEVKIVHEVSLDPAGLGKGFIVDQMIKFLQEQAVESVLINAGGDLSCFGDPQPVYIRHPVDQALSYGPFELLDLSLATSAGTYLPSTVQSQFVYRGVIQIIPNKSFSVACKYLRIADALTKVLALDELVFRRLAGNYQATGYILDKKLNLTTVNY